MITWFSRKKKVAHHPSKKGSDDFVSLSSHELRSPLSIIKWYTEILLDGDAGPLTEEQRKYLTTIESSNQRAIDLVRSLLNVSRLDLGTFSILPEEVSIPSLVLEVRSIFESGISKKNLLVSVNGDTAIQSIHADKHLCLMVIKSLFSNAVLFSKDNGKVDVSYSKISAGTTVNGKMITEESILLSVADNGIGIPEEEVSKIFSKMYKASNVNDSEIVGSGLSLYIAKTILEYVDGNIWFSSTLEEGSTFYVTFPVKGMKKKEGRTTLD